MNWKLKPVSPQGIVTVPGMIVWCGTMVRTDDNRCHMMLSVWPEELGFDAWLYHSRIAYAVAEHLGAPYVYQGEVLRGDDDGNAWDYAMVHNPWIISHNKKFYMYYTGNCGDGSFSSHRYNQRVGLAVADNPAGPWVRCGQVLKPSAQGSWDELVSCNPSVCQMPDGRFVMLYRACSSVDNKVYYGKIMLGVAFAQSPEGPFIRYPEPIFQLNGIEFAAEDPGVFCFNNKLYAIFKDMGNFYNTDFERSLILAESTDGTDWRVVKPLLTRQVDFAGKGTEEVFRLERPFVFVENDAPKQLFVAARPCKEKEHAFNIHSDLVTI